MQIDFNSFGINFQKKLTGTFPLYTLFIKKNISDNSLELIDYSYFTASQRYLKEPESYINEYSIDLEEHYSVFSNFFNKGVSFVVFAYFNPLLNEWTYLKKLYLSKTIDEKELNDFIKDSHTKFFNDCYLNDKLFWENINSIDYSKSVFQINKYFSNINLFDLSKKLKFELLNNISQFSKFKDNKNENIYLINDLSFINSFLKIEHCTKEEQQNISNELIDILKHYDILNFYVKINDNEYCSLGDYLNSDQSNIFENKDIHCGIHKRFSHVVLNGQNKYNCLI